MTAALAYYTLFSIAPLLIVVIAIVGFLFGAEFTQVYASKHGFGMKPVKGAALISEKGKLKNVIT